MIGRLNLPGALIVLTLLPFLFAAVPAADAGRSLAVRGEREFAEGDLDGVSVLSTGELVLAPDLEPISGFDANFVWDMKPCPEGRLLVASGAPGAVYEVDGDEARLLHRTSEEHVLSVLPMADGSVLLGTAPRGIIYRIAHDGAVTVFAGLDVNYVWDMRPGPDGAVYCATGPGGRLLRLDMDGEVSEVFSAPQQNLLCLAIDEGNRVIYAGTQPGGIVYRVKEDGEYTVVFDAEEDEIRDMIITEDGVLYVCTAQSEFQAENMRRREQGEQNGSPRIHTAGRNGSSGVLPGEIAASNSIYRIEYGEGAYRVARFPEAMVLALARWEGEDEVLAGTGVDGRLIGVRSDGRTRIIAETGARHVSALCKMNDGAVMMGTSNPGRLLRVRPDYRPQGTYTSRVFDAEYLSRWGAVNWLGAVPAAAGVELYMRTGNSREPDGTWSAWAGPIVSPGRRPDVPMGRFAQARIVLSTQDSSQTPEINSFMLHYRQANRRPAIDRLEVGEHEGGRDGAPRLQERTITWSASDPNRDELESSLFYRGVDERDWKELRTAMREETSCRWDTSRVPDGYYLVRLVVTDRPSRGEDEALQDEKVFGPFLIDNGPPVISDLGYARTDGRAVFEISGVASDRASNIAAIQVSRNAGDWQPVFPADGMFDSRREEFTFVTQELDPGEHVFVFTAEDGAGNKGSGKIIINVQ